MTGNTRRSGSGGEDEHRHEASTPIAGLLEVYRRLGIEEVSIHGFTKANVHRPAVQVEAFRTACVATLLVVNGDL